MSMWRVLVLSALAGAAGAAQWFVAPNGDDAASGAIGAPFATIQHAVTTAGTGDVVFARGGAYHETVDLAGVEELVIAAYSNETARIDGSFVITNTWTAVSNGIWKTTLEEPVWQLWLGDEPMTLARFPNTDVWSEHMWDRYAARRYEAAAGTNGFMVDDPEVGADESLAEAGVSFNDCVAVLNTRNWTTYARLVENHAAGSDSFTYAPPPHYKSTRAAYFMEGGVNDAELVMLDRPNEWGFDESNNTLYLKTADGLAPAGVARARNQDYFFAGDATTKNIEIDGFDFFGATFGFVNSAGITVRNCDFLYPSASKRALGSLDPPNPTRFQATVDCSLINCDFRYVDGPALYYKWAENTRIENNYFYMIDYGCLAEGYSLNGNSTRGVVYRRNTLEITGASEGCRIGNDQSRPAIVEFNYHTRCGSQQTDGASVQFSPASASNSVGRFNWFIDNERYSYRWDGDPGGHHARFHRNVSRTPRKTAFRLKGDWHQIHNNTAITAGGDMNISIDKGGNPNSVSRNNAADKFTVWPIPGTASHNHNANAGALALSEALRDPANLDFRPRFGSPLIDAGTNVAGVTEGFAGTAPDIGAYEFGEADYFIPGRVWPRASRPVPPNSAANVKTNASLMWLRGLDAVSHDIYFGDSIETLAFQTNQLNNIFEPGSLAPGGRGVWRVDVVKASGVVVTGETWSFSVEPAVLSATNFVLTPIADAYVDSALSDQNFGAETTIDLRTPEIDGVSRHGYLKFQLPAFEGAVVGATLRLYSGASVSGGVSAHEVANDAWDEFAIVWTNRPALSAEPLASGGVANGWGELELTNGWPNSAEIWSLGLVRGPKDSNRSVESRESAHPPELILRVMEIDSDGDGMADDWEIAYFGDVSYSDGQDDANGDGFSDYAEFLAGTDPTNAASRFFIAEFEPAADSARLRFSSAPRRFYAVETAENLRSGPWIAFTNGIAGTGEDVTIETPAGGTNRFFRARVGRD